MQYFWTLRHWFIQMKAMLNTVIAYFEILLADHLLHSQPHWLCNEQFEIFENSGHVTHWFPSNFSLNPQSANWVLLPHIIHLPVKTLAMKWHPTGLDWWVIWYSDTLIKLALSQILTALTLNSTMCSVASCRWLSSNEWVEWERGGGGLACFRFIVIQYTQESHTESHCCNVVLNRSAKMIKEGNS